ncbi:MAG: histidinol dehydrogenase, partial [Spirochaetaceae bacterium]|nr:histidinol dehydrogenase [Spirochaetaceae bacterium]
MEQIRTIRSRDVRDDFYKPHFQESAAEIVRTIIENVRRWGDDAVTEYSAAFDKITPASLRIPAEATQAALANLQANEPALY